jgi:putative CRISPR-associated protein (TIGR02619 family)
MKSKTIVITCGTSLLTNIDKHKHQPFVYKNANKDEKDLSSQDKKVFEELFESVKNHLNNNKDNFDELKKSSAELNTIVSYYNEDLKNISGDCFYLFTTDTYAGKNSGKILKEFLSTQHNLTAHSIKVDKLKADTKNNFEEGIKSVFAESLQSIYNDSNREVVFILSGGFKSWSGYMQAVGMFYADKILYQFETSGKEFIEIPKIPFELNDNQKQALRLLSVEKQPTENLLSTLPKTAYLQIGDLYSLDGNGKLLWDNLLKSGFYNVLQESLSDKLSYSPDFKKDYEKCNEQERKVLGEKIDSLAMFLNTNDGRYNPKSLNWHDLININGYQQEFYPFDGNDSRRVYAKQQSGKFVLDKIGKHLKC